MKKISPALVLAARASEAIARKVQDERDELASARRHQQWSLWYGDYRSADRASEQAREEEAELSAAQQKLNHDVSDVQRDRAELYQDEPHRWHWWGRRWFGGDDND